MSLAAPHPGRDVTRLLMLGTGEPPQRRRGSSVAQEAFRKVAAVFSNAPGKEIQLPHLTPLRHTGSAPWQDIHKKGESVEREQLQGNSKFLSAWLSAGMGKVCDWPGIPPFSIHLKLPANGFSTSTASNGCSTKILRL